MDEYLEDYCSFISSLKKSITIADSGQYVLDHEFDIAIISKQYQSHINLENIFGLVENRQFYAGHNIGEKYRLLLQCLEILHNYSKNLLVNFNIYSTKAIQEVNTNIKDYLAFLPYYSTYLSTLLGYEFNPNKSEWFIEQKSLGRKHRLRLAVVCVLCAHAHGILTEMQTNDDRPSHSPDIDHQQNTTSDSLAYSSIKWKCEMCEALNIADHVNCAICYTPRTLPEQPCQPVPAEETLIARKGINSDCWECSCCTFLNQSDNGNCEVCGTSNQPVTPLWNCDHCTFRNSLEDQFCLICSKPRFEPDPALPVENNPIPRIPGYTSCVEIGRTNDSLEPANRIKETKSLNYEVNSNRKNSPSKKDRPYEGRTSYPNKEINGSNNNNITNGKPNRPITTHNSPNQGNSKIKVDSEIKAHKNPIGPRDNDNREIQAPRNPIGRRDNDNKEIQAPKNPIGPRDNDNREIQAPRNPIVPRDNDNREIQAHRNPIGRRDNVNGEVSSSNKKVNIEDSIYIAKTATKGPYKIIDETRANDRPNTENKRSRQTEDNVHPQRISDPNKEIDKSHKPPSRGDMKGQVNRGQEIESDSKSSEPTEKVFRAHGDHRVEHGEKIQEVPGSSQCDMCNLDDKNRLFNQSGKRIHKCDFCERRGKKTFWKSLNCFGD